MALQGSSWLIRRKMTNQWRGSRAPPRQLGRCATPRHPAIGLSAELDQSMNGMLNLKHLIVMQLAQFNDN